MLKAVVIAQLSLDEILASARSLPSAPRVFARINAAMANPNTSIYEVADLVKVDPSLSASLLQVANSSLYRRGEEVDSIDQAINRVGLRELHRLVALAMAQQMAVGGLPAYGVSAERLWENSVMVALALAGLAKAAGQDERQAYTIGLLRSIGFALFQVLVRKRDLPELTTAERTPRGREEWELRHFGTTAPEVSEKLLRAWEFPREIAAAVGAQYRPDRSSGASRWAALLHLAVGQTEVLSREMPFEKGSWRKGPTIIGLAGLQGIDPATLIPALHEQYVSVRAALNGP